MGVGLAINGVEMRGDGVVAAMTRGDEVAKPPAAGALPGAGGFADLMRLSFDRMDAGRTQREQVNALANQFVAIALVKPLLAEARQSPFQSQLLHGGHGEAMFQEHLDTVITGRVAQRMQLKLGEVMSMGTL